MTGMSEITEEMAEAVAARIYGDAHAGMKNVWDWHDSGLDDEHPGTRERYIRYAKSAMSALAATPSSRSLAEAVERWRRARIAACEVGLQHPDYMDRLNELSEAEDALSVAKEPR